MTEGKSTETKWASGEAREAAFQKMFDSCEAALRRIVWEIAKNKEDRQDLMQEIKIVLWNSHPGFRGECSEITWAGRVARTVAFRFADKTHDWILVGDEYPEHLQPETSEDEKNTDDEITLQNLKKNDHKLVLLLRKGYQFKEMRKEFGVNRNTLYQRVYALRQLFKNKPDPEK
jgi:RNA polymerase sigma factor (sigma-70 family)